MIINTYKQLTRFIIDQNLNPKQAQKLIAKGLKVWFINDYSSTKELIETLDLFWAKWGKYQEKPLFVDVDLND